jgi:hypothetical protein
MCAAKILGPRGKEGLRIMATVAQILNDLLKPAASAARGIRKIDYIRMAGAGKTTPAVKADSGESSTAS